VRKLLLAFVPLLLFGGLAIAAQQTDYVTEEEEDLIRDAQGLKLRVPLYLRLLDNRIVALGLRERTAKEREQTKKDIAEYDAQKKEIEKASKIDPRVKDAEIRAKPVNPDVYLRDYTKAELLRGYMQIIDETMDNIEDAYDRNLDVREYVESLNKFVGENLPRLKTFQPKSDSETSALKATIKHSEEALQDIQTALKAVPKPRRLKRRVSRPARPWNSSPSFARHICSSSRALPSLPSKRSSFRSLD
jgi:hypothetical protein